MRGHQRVTGSREGLTERSIDILANVHCAISKSPRAGRLAGIEGVAPAMKGQAAAIAVLAGLLAAGCGGGSSAKTVTVSAPATGASAPATTGTTETPQQALNDYLNELKPRR